MSALTTDTYNALIAAAKQIVDEFDQHGEVLQLGHDDDDGSYGSTSAIEKLRAALTQEARA